MQEYSIHFETSQGRKTKSGMIVPINYNFWESLISFFVKNVLILGLTVGLMKKQPLKEQKYLEEFLRQA